MWAGRASNKLPSPSCSWSSHQPLPSLCPAWSLWADGPWSRAPSVFGAFEDVSPDGEAHSRGLFLLPGLNLPIIPAGTDPGAGGKQPPYPSSRLSCPRPRPQGPWLPQPASPAPPRKCRSLRHPPPAQLTCSGRARLRRLPPKLLAGEFRGRPSPLSTLHPNPQPWKGPQTCLLGARPDPRGFASSQPWGLGWGFRRPVEPTCLAPNPPRPPRVLPRR